MTKTHVKILILVLAAMYLLGTTGCAHTAKAIDNARLQVTTKMSDSIFLSAESVAKNKTVFIRNTNTSDLQEVDLAVPLKEALAKRGLTVVNDPSNAGFIIQTNVLYFDYEKDTATADGMLAGGFGGAIAGANMAKGGLIGAAVGAAVGVASGAVVGSAFKVETFVGATDVLIRERQDEAMTAKTKAETKQGSTTTVTTERETKTNYQNYQTRVVSKATRTNINKSEAAVVVADKIADKIAGLF